MNATLERQRVAGPSTIRTHTHPLHDTAGTSADDPELCAATTPRDGQTASQRFREAGGSLPPLLKRVIVPIDETEISSEAIPVAHLIARRLNLSVRLIGVLDPQRLLPPALAYRAAVNPSLFRELLANQILEMHRTLVESVRKLTRENVDASYTLLRGSLERCIEQETMVGDVVIMAVPGSSTETRTPSDRDELSRSGESGVPSIVVFGPLRSPIAAALVDELTVDRGLSVERDATTIVV